MVNQSSSAARLEKDRTITRVVPSDEMDIPLSAIPTFVASGQLPLPTEETRVVEQPLPSAQTCVIAPEALEDLRQSSLPLPPRSGRRGDETVPFLLTRSR